MTEFCIQNQSGLCQNMIGDNFSQSDPGSWDFRECPKEDYSPALFCYYLTSLQWEQVVLSSKQKV